VGKSRVEALAEVQETVDLIRWYCREMQDNRGFVRSAFGLQGQKCCACASNRRRS
jgi:1-pyrroline-5-carboxylate dehydrogenase